MSSSLPKLKLLPVHQYRGVNEEDPIRYYYWPVFGSMYRRRVELALNECRGGQRVLEVGFGTGLTFLNLDDLYCEIHGIDLTADVPQVKSVFAGLGIQTQLQNGNVLRMPYEDDFFDTVLLISILEHLKPEDQPLAFAEIKRVLKPGGQLVYGVPVERPLMVFLFRVLGHDIRKEHFSTEEQVAMAASGCLRKERIVEMKSMFPFLGKVYEVGHFVKV